MSIDIEQQTDSVMVALEEHYETIEYFSSHFGCSPSDIITAAMVTGFEVASYGNATAFKRNLARINDKS